MSYSKNTTTTNDNIKEFYDAVFDEKTLMNILSDSKQALEQGKQFIVIRQLNWKQGERLYGDFWDGFLKKTKTQCMSHLRSYGPIDELLTTFTPCLVIGPYKNNDPVHSRRDIKLHGGPRYRYNAILVFTKAYKDEHITFKPPRSKKSSKSDIVDRATLPGYSKSTRRHKKPTLDLHIEAFHGNATKEVTNPFSVLSDVAGDPSEIKEDYDVKTDDEPVRETVNEDPVVEE
tara:strand:+ start:2400 stop:3092 length:693 start_codon:yes stop_codon:yes gene_type:complete